MKFTQEHMILLMMVGCCIGLGIGIVSTRWEYEKKIQKLFQEFPMHELNQPLKPQVILQLKWPQQMQVSVKLQDYQWPSLNNDELQGESQ